MIFKSLNKRTYEYHQRHRKTKKGFFLVQFESPSDNDDHLGVELSLSLTADGVAIFPPSPSTLRF